MPHDIILCWLNVVVALSSHHQHPPPPTTSLQQIVVHFRRAVFFFCRQKQEECVNCAVFLTSVAPSLPWVVILPWVFARPPSHLPTLRNMPNFSIALQSQRTWRTQYDVALCHVDCWCSTLAITVTTTTTTRGNWSVNRFEMKRTYQQHAHSRCHKHLKKIEE